jgi:hypothetical protein
MHNLSEHTQIVLSIGATAAGTADTITGTAVDTLGWDGILIIASFGVLTSTAVTTFKVQGGSVSDGSDAADIAGTAQSVADDQDGKLVACDIYRPMQRYIRPAIVRLTANAVINNAIAILYRGELTPAAVHSTLVRTPEVFNSPALGTA